jgi:Erg28 like protein
MDAVISFFQNQQNLKYWLLLVASLRLLSVYLGYIQPSELQKNVFPPGAKQYTGLVGRTFAVWTSVTCAITIQTAYNLNNGPLVRIGIFTFLVANTYFALEYLVFKSVSLKSITLPFIFATSSSLWLYLVALPNAKF